MTSYAMNLAEIVSVQEIPTENVIGGVEIADTATLTDLADAFKEIADTLTESMTLTPLAEASAEFVAAATDGVILADSAVDGTVALIVLAEGVILEELVTPNAVLGVLAEEGVEITAILILDGEAYIVWVANAETLAHSQYANFDFNSLARIGSRYYGAKDDGIYLLDGEDDAGADIQYFVTLPETDFGAGGLKRLPKAYMGFTNSGDMRLKVITREGTELIYAFSKSSEAYGESSANIGRGLKSRSFTFDLFSVEGGDVELEHVEFFPIFLRRK